MLVYWSGPKAAAMLKASYCPKGYKSLTYGMKNLIKLKKWHISKWKYCCENGFNLPFLLAIIKLSMGQFHIVPEADMLLK